MADRSDHRLAAALLAVAGLFAIAVYAGSVVRDVRGASRHVTVKGFAQRGVRSDLAIWTGSLTARSREMSQAYREIEADLARVLAFLGEAGIPREQISVSPVSIQTRFRQGEQGYFTNEVELYELGQTPDARVEGRGARRDGLEGGDRPDPRRCRARLVRAGLPLHGSRRSQDRDARRGLRRRQAAGGRDRRPRRGPSWASSPGRRRGSSRSRRPTRPRSRAKACTTLRRSRRRSARW